MVGVGSGAGRVGVGWAFVGEGPPAWASSRPCRPCRAWAERPTRSLRRTATPTRTPTRGASPDRVFRHPPRGNRGPRRSPRTRRRAPPRPAARPSGRASRGRPRRHRRSCSPRTRRRPGRRRPDGRVRTWRARAATSGRCGESPCPTPAARKKTRERRRDTGEPPSDAERYVTCPSRPPRAACLRGQAATRTRGRAATRSHPYAPACARASPPVPEDGSRASVTRAQRARPRIRHPYPRACSRASSMPKWWAISWTTVTSVSATTSSRVAHIRSVGPR